MMSEKKTDPFVEALNKWKVRIEQLAFFFLLVVHLLLIQLMGLSLLWHHVQKITNGPTTSESKQVK